VVGCPLTILEGNDDLSLPKGMLQMKFRSRFGSVSIYCRKLWTIPVALFIYQQSIYCLYSRRTTVVPGLLAPIRLAIRYAETIFQNIPRYCQDDCLGLVRSSVPTEQHSNRRASTSSMYARHGSPKPQRRSLGNNCGGSCHQLR